METQTNPAPTAPATETPNPAPEATPAPTETPTLYAGKFKTVEDMEKSYKELETRLGSTPKTEPAAEAAPAPEAAPTPEGQPTPEAKSVLAQAGIDFDSLSKEYMDAGALSEDSLTKLRTAGFSQEVIDNYIAGAEAQAQAVVTDIQNHVGGEEAFNALLEWGGANMTPEEIAAFNAALDAPDINQTKLALDGVRAKMAASDTAPKLISSTNTNGAPAPAAGFGTQAEMMAAINKRDERGRQLYGADPAYTQEVENKIKASSFL